MSARNLLQDARYHAPNKSQLKISTFTSKNETSFTLRKKLSANGPSRKIKCQVKEGDENDNTFKITQHVTPHLLEYCQSGHRTE
ncbi:hypothetical protein AA0475_2375 [Acetobacter peroxydans]|nr:hypothetical protein AA0475_2375 [Acetobacter peroxydans]